MHGGAVALIAREVGQLPDDVSEALRCQRRDCAAGIPFGIETVDWRNSAAPRSGWASSSSAALVARSTASSDARASTPASAPNTENRATMTTHGAWIPGMTIISLAIWPDFRGKYPPILGG